MHVLEKLIAYGALPITVSGNYSFFIRANLTDYKVDTFTGFILNQY